jgi:hypothetical protein
MIKSVGTRIGAELWRRLLVAVLTLPIVPLACTDSPTSPSQTAIVTFRGRVKRFACKLLGERQIAPHERLKPAGLRASRMGGSFSAQASTPGGAGTSKMWSSSRGYRAVRRPAF